VTPVRTKGPQKPPKNKRINTMPRKTKDTDTKDIDPENIYNLQTAEEVEDFLDTHTIKGLDAYRDAYNDRYYDYDNYGYSDY
jgi:hypothetical protein